MPRPTSLPLDKDDYWTLTPPRQPYIPLNIYSTRLIGVVSNLQALFQLTLAPSFETNLVVVRLFSLTSLSHARSYPSIVMPIIRQAFNSHYLKSDTLLHYFRRLSHQIGSSINLFEFCRWYCRVKWNFAVKYWIKIHFKSYSKQTQRVEDDVQVFVPHWEVFVLHWRKFFFFS